MAEIINFDKFRPEEGGANKKHRGSPDAGARSDRQSLERGVGHLSKQIAGCTESIVALEAERVDLRINHRIKIDAKRELELHILAQQEELRETRERLIQERNRLQRNLNKMENK